ncbi:MAG TPA: hypothetical protein VGJ21_06415 [Terracidiphilus sp.]|jgi:hypothetical protein
MRFVTKSKWWIALIAPPAIALFVWAFGEIIMHLWNWLLPSLFGWHVITFWQALGLLVLCRILFGGFGNSGHRGGKRRRERQRMWETLTPEEREQLRQRMGNRCGPFSAPETEGKPA